MPWEAKCGHAPWSGRFGGRAAAVHVQHVPYACERALKPVAIGRKNWLFCASEGGGERAAAFFTLLVSARLHEVEPWAWLRDVFDRMARLRAAGDDLLRPLLPQNWLAEHPDKRVPYGR